MYEQTFAFATYDENSLMNFLINNIGKTNNEKILKFICNDERYNKCYMKDLRKYLEHHKFYILTDLDYNHHYNFYNNKSQSNDFLKKENNDYVNIKNYKGFINSLNKTWKGTYYIIPDVCLIFNIDKLLHNNNILIHELDLSKLDDKAPIRIVSYSNSIETNYNNGFVLSLYPDSYITIKDTFIYNNTFLKNNIIQEIYKNWFELYANIIIQLNTITKINNNISILMDMINNVVYEFVKNIEYFGDYTSNIKMTNMINNYTKYFGKLFQLRFKKFYYSSYIEAVKFNKYNIKYIPDCESQTTIFEEYLKENL